MLNERNKGNKKLKNAAMKEKGIKRKFSGRKTAIDGDHPHGTYGEKRGVRREPARKVGSITMTGRTGTTATDTKEPRLVDRKGKRRKVATELLKNKSTSAGPKGKLPDHTVYHDMGMLMAESLGLVSEEDEPKQMDDVGQWNKPGDLKKRATKAKAAGKKPAKSVRRKPDSIDYPRGGRP